MSRRRSNGASKFLRDEGIERLTEEQITEKFLSEGKGMLGKSLRYLFHQSHQLGVPIERIPAYYDTFQSRPVVYDYMKSLMDKLAQEVKGLGEEAVVIEGDCRTGLYIDYLASQFRNMDFFGYDKSMGMVKLAEKRRKRLCLENAGFYRREHLRPSEEELQIADLVFTSDLRYPRTEEGCFAQFEAICRRVKPGGMYINAGFQHETPDEVKEQLAEMGIEYLRTKEVSRFFPAKEMSKEDARRCIMPPSIFYMDIFKVDLPQ